LEYTRTFAVHHGSFCAHPLSGLDSACAPALQPCVLAALVPPLSDGKRSHAHSLRGLLVSGTVTREEMTLRPRRRPKKQNNGSRHLFHPARPSRSRRTTTCWSSCGPSSETHSARVWPIGADNRCRLIISGTFKGNVELTPIAPPARPDPAKPATPFSKAM